MKKFFKAITAIAMAISATSCGDWLEAVSSTQVEAYKLFEQKAGYYDALSGVYIDMGTKYAYGQYMTMMMPDLVAYPYLVSTTQSVSMWQTHSYQSSVVQSGVTAIWGQSYNIIANINLELSQLEAHRSLFSEQTEFNLIKGELLALRAYVHLDLMRLFGVAHPGESANASKVTIPYATTFSMDAAPQLSYAQTREMLMADIEQALECLQDDPVRGRMTESFQNAANSEGYWDKRAKHMNYYAVLGLAARAYQWFGDTATAAQYAQKAAQGALQASSVSWYDFQTNLVETDYFRMDLTFSSEHLFSLEVTGLYEYANSFYVSSSNGGIFLTTSFVDEVLFPVSDPETGSLAGREDVRGPLMLLSPVIGGYRNVKLYGSSSSTLSFRNRMPMIRLSEMYYIMAEDLIAKGDNAGALKLLDVVRHARGITSDLPDTRDAMRELSLEYYREFTNEGQLFHWLKHTDLKYNMGNGYFELDVDNLTFPYPQSELAYGRNQEL